MLSRRTTRSSSPRSRRHAAGAVAAGDDDADVLGQPGHELLPQPGVEQPQALVGVDAEDDAAVDGSSSASPSAARNPRSVGSTCRAVERHDAVRRGRGRRLRRRGAASTCRRRRCRARTPRAACRPRGDRAAPPARDPSDERDKALVEHRLQRARHRAPSLHCGRGDRAPACGVRVVRSSTSKSPEYTAAIAGSTAGRRTRAPCDVGLHGRLALPVVDAAVDVGARVGDPRLRAGPVDLRELARPPRSARRSRRA